MTFPRLPRLFAMLLAAGMPVAALGQGASVGFGGIRGDPTLPVEVRAEEFVVDQNDGSAVLTGDVVIVQGEMRLSAAQVRIEYAADDRSRIERMIATGGVTLVSGSEAAEAAEAEYTIDTGTVVLKGNVLLTQGPNTMTGQMLTVDLTSGTGRMQGGVKTILQPGGN